MIKKTVFKHDVGSDVGNFFYSLKNQGLDITEVLTLTAAYINAQITTQAWKEIEMSKLMFQQNNANGGN